METDSLEKQQRQCPSHRLLVISVVVLALLTLIANSIQGIRSRNRLALVKRLQQVIPLEPILSAQEESLLREANDRRRSDGILNAEANSRRLLDGPVRAIFGRDEYSSVVLPDLSSLEQLDTLHEMQIRPAYIPKSQLNHLPAPPSVRTLRMANYLTACSETCVVEAADTRPPKPEFAWDGTDMMFLSRMRNLRELELRALWLRTGVLDVVAELPHLEMLSLNRSDFPCDELSSLQRLRNLRVLTFWNTPKAMRSLEWLREMDSLEELTLIGGGQIDAKMLEPLAQLPRLQTLRLDFGGLSDDAWPVLATFQDLRILTLSYTNWFNASPFAPDNVAVDPTNEAPGSAGHKDVPGLKQLEWLDISSSTFFAEESLQSLVASLPKECKVVVNQSHLSMYHNRSYSVATRLTGVLRTDLELPVEY